MTAVGDWAVWLVPAAVFLAIMLLTRYRPRLLYRARPVPAEELAALADALGGGGRLEVEALLRRRRKIEAIRRVRQRTGASLVAAKALVESLDPNRDPGNGGGR